MSLAAGSRAFRWPDDALALGFRQRSARGRAPAREWSRRALALRPDGSWLRFVDRKPSACGAARPGPWRAVRSGAGLEQVFDLPPLVADAVAMADPRSGWLAWAESTRDGVLPHEWAPPDGDEVQSWVAPSHLRARSAEHAALGALEVRADRLAVVFPRVVSLSEALPDARAAWVREICQAGQDRWRLVRFGVDECPAAVRAAVDLSGVPAAFARPMVELSAAALVCAVAWVLPGLHVAIDAGVDSRLLDRGPRWVRRVR